MEIKFRKVIAVGGTTTLTTNTVIQIIYAISKTLHSTKLAVTFNHGFLKLNAVNYFCKIAPS